MKVTNEWFITAPWGKLALISWGNPTSDPVLLVHGRLDSAATFIPLLELLPDKYYYVGVDMPGNGLSDPFPIGVMITKFHFMGAIEAVIKHFGWKSFVFIGHSMGCEQGFFYNVIHPGCIKKLVYLDAGPSLQRLQVHSPQEYFSKFYKEYYSNYWKYFSKGKVYTRRKALEAIMTARGLNETQADIVLSRNLIAIGEDQYRLSWDIRMKSPATQNFPMEYYCKLFSLNTPPTILITASNSAALSIERKEAADRIIKELEMKTDHFKVINVEGPHDLHVTHPERIAVYICQFLNQELEVKSKL